MLNQDRRSPEFGLPLNRDRSTNRSLTCASIGALSENVSFRRIGPRSTAVLACAMLILVAVCHVLKTGAIEGNAFLRMQSGDTKRGAGLLLRLLREPDSMAAVVYGECKRFNERANPLLDRARAYFDSQVAVVGTDRYEVLRKARDAANDTASALHVATVGSIDATIRDLTVDSTRTGMNAEFRFLSVPPGRYAVYGAWDVGDHHYQWLAPVAVTARVTTKLNLDNAAERGALLSCFGSS